MNKLSRVITATGLLAALVTAVTLITSPSKSPRLPVSKQVSPELASEYQSCTTCDRPPLYNAADDNFSDPQIKRAMYEYQSAKATLIIPTGTTLEEQFNAIQALQFDYFADKAAEVFARENAYYRYKAASQRLQESIRYLPVSEQLDALAVLKNSAQHNPTPYEQYKEAMQIYNQADISLKDLSINEIAQRYLPGDEAQLAVKRWDKRQKTLSMQKNFQQAYNAFSASLDIARSTDYATLDDEQWQQLKRRKQRAFRVSYFASGDE